MRAVRLTGYVPNLVAGSLASKRTNVVAAIVPAIDNPAYGKTIHATSEVLRKNGFHLLLGHHGFSLVQEESLIAAFLGRRPDGIILHGRRHTPGAVRLLEGAGVPIVELGELGGRPLDMVVSYSNFEAARALTSYLVRRGHQRIAIVSFPRQQSERHYQRWRGYRAALREFGQPYHSTRSVETVFGYHKGAEALLTLLKQDPHVDAVFFTSDVLAVGAQFECLRRGWKIPEQFAIAGFDDQDIASEAVPALTTVHVPREKIGCLAGQMLLDRASGKAVDPKIVDVGFRLIERESA